MGEITTDGKCPTCGHSVHFGGCNVPCGDPATGTVAYLCGCETNKPTDDGTAGSYRYRMPRTVG